MERRNLDFGIELSEAQWAALGRTARASEGEDGAYAWDPDDADRIVVRFRSGDVPNLWRDWVGEPGTYGAVDRPACHFLFNGGRPFAEIELPDLAEQPVVSDDEADAMRAELDAWVRAKWHELMRRSGLHYERGHLPQR